MRADALHRRTAIIAAACQLFRTHGDDVALEEVATQAGVSVATVYRATSPTARTLSARARNIMGDAFAKFQQRLIADFENSTHSGEDYVRTYAAHILTMGLNTLIPAFIPQGLDSLSPELIAQRDLLERNGRRFIELAQKQGEIGPGVTHLEFIVGLLSLARPREVDIEDYQPDIQEKIIDLFLAGIKSGHRA